MTGGNESQAVPSQNPAQTEQPSGETSSAPESRAAGGNLAEKLDILTGLYANGSINLVEACHRLNDVLRDTEGVTEQQRGALCDKYLERFDQAKARREQRIERGTRGTSPVDRSTQENTSESTGQRQSLLTLAFGRTSSASDPALRGGARRARDDEGDDSGGTLKRLREISDNHDPLYAWNWKFNSGRAPWIDTDNLSIGEKMHIL